MILTRTARLGLCLSLIAPTLSAQAKKDPPKPDPKTPPVVISNPTAATIALRPPLELDTIRFFVQIPEAGGGTRASADGRYVALNHPATMVALINQSGAPIIMRGTVSARLYRGTPPETPPVSVTTVSRTTVQQMFDEMARYADLQYSTRTRLLGTLAAGQREEYYGRLANNLDSLATMEYQRATWSPRFTVVAETGVPYTLRADVAHEGDGGTRYYRADLSFRFDSNGRMIGQRITYPPPPAPTTGRPSVEVGR